MSAATEDTFNKFIKTIGTFQSMKDDLDEDYYADLEEIVNNAMTQVSDRTGRYLHSLHELDDKKPDENTLKMIIDNVPSSLSYEDEDGDIPIQTAVHFKESVHYVPLLAKEGVKHNVGGDDARGGLLGDHNVLQGLACRGNSSESYVLYLDVMKKLRESKLLLREDIQDHNLLSWACNPKTPMRFEYLIDWCPEGLKTHQLDGLPLIHGIIHNRPIELFSMFLKTALRYYPNDLGLFLFLKDREGQTACERAFKKYGTNESMAAIGDLIPFDDPKVPILHHVAKHAPQCMKYFACRYLSASYFRDCEGRTLHQAALASGNKTFIDDPIFFLAGMSDEQVREIDPGSDLYPFMVAASGETCDLSAVYALLRRNPSLAHRNKPKRRRKRKRK